MSPVFVGAALVAVAGAVGMVAARPPVHGVIAMLVNFIGLAALYLSLDAEFLAIAQIIVYAGAVLVLFLFVLALMTARKDPIERPTGQLRYQGVLGTAAAVALLGIVALGVLPRVKLELGPAGTPGEGFGTVAGFGLDLLGKNLFAFELTALVLLVAVVGVMVLVGHRRRPDQQAGGEGGR